MTFMILLFMLLRGLGVVSLHPSVVKVESEDSRDSTELAAATAQIDALKHENALLKAKAEESKTARQLHEAKKLKNVAKMQIFAQQPAKAEFMLAKPKTHSKEPKLDFIPSATYANTVTATSVDHAKGAAHVGEYFNFDRPSAWTSGHAVDVTQCRDGQQIWSGKIVWWQKVNGGSTGNSHGRRHSDSSAGQWQVNDTITDGICQAEANAEVAVATAASLSTDLMVSEQQGLNDLMAEFRPDVEVIDDVPQHPMASGQQGLNDLMASFRPDAVIDDEPQHHKRSKKASKVKEQSSRLKHGAIKKTKHSIGTSTDLIRSNAVLLPLALLLLVLLVVLGLFCEDRDDSFTNRLAKGGKI